MTYEDGSPVIEPCTSVADLIYLLMRYIMHLLNGADPVAIWQLLAGYAQSCGF